MGIQNTDEFLLEREGTLYKTTGAEIAAFAGSGGFGLTQVNLASSPPFMCSKEVVHVDASVSPTSKIMTFLVPNDHNDAEDLNDSNITIVAKPETGQIRFTISGLGLLCGPFTVNYGVL